MIEPLNSTPIDMSENCRHFAAAYSPHAVSNSKCRCVRGLSTIGKQPDDLDKIIEFLKLP